MLRNKSIIFQNEIKINNILNTSCLILRVKIYTHKHNKLKIIFLNNQIGNKIKIIFFNPYIYENNKKLKFIHSREN